MSGLARTRERGDRTCCHREERGRGIGVTLRFGLTLAEGSYHLPRWEGPRAQQAWGQDAGDEVKGQVESTLAVVFVRLVFRGERGSET